MSKTIAVLLCLLPTALPAWEFSPAPICTLTRTEPAGTMTVTFDPMTGLYALHVRRAGGWPDAPRFSIRFSGTTTITTDRHRVDGDRLTVTDRGFGNVLSGLAAGGRAIATSGDVTVSLDLTDAADPVAAFRTCPSAPSV